MINYFFKKRIEKYLSGYGLKILFYPLTIK